jgi:dolichol-phosphate mannosyltransferase
VAPPRLAIVVPTRNEVENVAELIQQLHALGLDLSVYVMDDDSTDGTVEVVERLARSHPNLALVRRTANPGYGRACIEGLQRAVAAGAERVVQMDADLSHDPRYVPALLAASEEADLVLGSRYVHGVSVVNWSLKRLALSVGANQYARTLAGLRVRDCTTGFRLWRRSLLERLPLGQIRSNGYSFLIETLFHATREGARIVEVPIVFVERRSGESKLGSRVFLESCLLPWRLLARRALRGAERRRVGCASACGDASSRDGTTSAPPSPLPGRPPA